MKTIPLHEGLDKCECLGLRLRGFYLEGTEQGYIPGGGGGYVCNFIPQTLF